MNNLSFFSVLRSNLKCAFCRNKKCWVRYYPNRRNVQIYNGIRHVYDCPKDRDKKLKKMLGKKLP